MIERARIPYRRKKHPVRYYSLSALQIVLVFALVFYYVVIISRLHGVQVNKVLIEGNHAVEASLIEKIARAPLEDKLMRVLRKDNRVFYPYEFTRQSLHKLDHRIADVDMHINNQTLQVSVREHEPVYRYCVFAFPSASSSLLMLPTALLASSSISTTVDTASASSSELLLEKNELSLLSTSRITDSSEQNCYWVNVDGVAFASSPEYSGSPMLTFTESDSSKFTGEVGSTPDILGTVVLGDSVRNFGMELRLGLIERSIPVYSFELLRDGDVRMQTGFEYPVFLSMQRTPKEVIADLSVALQSFSKNKTDTPKEYLDLRFRNKIFYK